MKAIILKSVSVVTLFAIISLGSCNIYDVPKQGTCTREIPANKITGVDQSQLQKDVAAIEKYLKDNSITAIKDPSGLYYEITKQGDDARPCLEKAILVKYTGKLMANGEIFDSDSKGAAFQLNTLIVGWQIGLLKVGRKSSITLYVPSVYGYGVDGFGTRIPTNSNLIFTIDLEDLQE